MCMIEGKVCSTASGPTKETEAIFSSLYHGSMITIFYYFFGGPWKQIPNYFGDQGNKFYAILVINATNKLYTSSEPCTAKFTFLCRIKTTNSTLL